MSFYEAVDLLTGLFESIVAYMLFDNYMNKREGAPRIVYFIGIFIMAAGIDCINTVFHYNILNVTFIVMLMVCFSFLYKPDLKTGIIISIVSVAVSSCIEVIILYVITTLLHCNATDIYYNPSLRLLGIMLSKSLNLIIIQAVCHIGNKKRLKIPALYWVLYLSIFAVDLTAVYLIFAPESSSNNSYMQAACSIGLLYSILITMYLYEKMSIQAETLKEKELLEQQYKHQVNHLKELVLTQEQVSLYHDLANHMVSLKSYMDHNNYDECNSYLSKLMDKLNNNSEIIDTGNIVIDAIISSKRNLAIEYGIQFDVDLQIPEKVKIDSSDCCVILGNALDNAIEASTKSANERYINIKMAYHDNILSCKIVNSVPGESAKNKLLKTTKSDAQNHGIGTKNIKRALEKYKSIYRMEYENNTFIFSFMIYDIFV